MLSLIVDDRERSVIQYLSPLVNIKIDRITTADYAIIVTVAGKAFILALIERKSLADLASSIKDGRMDNTKKMLAARTNGGCKLIYLIEGPSHPSNSRKFGGITYKCLKGKISSLMYRDNIQVEWTKNEQHTAIRMSELLKKFTELYNTGVFSHIVKLDVKDGGADDSVNDSVNGNADGSGNGTEPVTTSTPVELKKVHRKTLDTVHVEMLRSLKGITATTAVLLLKRYSIHDILMCNMEVSVISQLTYSSGFRLGKRGEDIYRTCRKLLTDNGRGACINILSCVHGVTVQTASSILDVVSFNDLVNGRVVKTRLSDIKKSAKRKVGPTVADRIIATFA
jgi:ERCC4-type nuclease